MLLLAHNIRSLHNVGAIFRSAAAFGVEHMYLTGVTGTPPRKEIAKVALGGERMVPWTACTIEEAIAECRKNGYALWGLETGGDDLGAVHCPDRVALVLGNEVEGIDAPTRALLQRIVSIPVGEKRSLNVSVAAGIAMYILRK